MDWTRQDRADLIRVYMVDPRSLEVRGELEGVLLDGSSVTWGYETDTRVSGTIKALDSNWIEHSLLRVVHEVPAEGYSNALATLVVTADPSEHAHGATVTTYECHSALSMLEADYLPYHLTIGANARSNDVVAKLLGGAGRPYSIQGDAINKRYSEAVVYPIGDSRLSDLFDIADASGNRIDVDGMGNVTWGRYVEPSKRATTWALDMAAADTNVLDGLESSSTRLSDPSRIVVTYKGSEERTVNGKKETVDVEIAAYADRTGEQTAAQRGYVIAEVVSIDELEPATKAQAQLEANSRIPSVDRREWQFSMLYMPIAAGDVLELTIPDGPDAGTHRALARNMELDLKTMVMKVTAKEI
ncbi:hypothetical protein AAY81_03920 [Denitrobacterium detoxificans]|uniref:Uncharacterized protein n=1 Tax=Denitrobacterium detoxificans TaxID=79604 RepID=A0A172RXE5_9ACTN|nr:hypothetical protein [Denitrobacterium detoxificans]ANE22411.1 hypothetical protein AAY81_03920 [Denitrobacterium detoxificans]SEP00790.1 hypothetical protein SAMN02910314_01899 [Denitrobacterium detoxificans]